MEAAVTGDFGVAVVVLGSIFLVVLMICWIVLPFAVIGTKPILSDILLEQRKTNMLLTEIRDAQRASTGRGQ